MRFCVAVAGLVVIAGTSAAAIADDDSELPVATIEEAPSDLAPSEPEPSYPTDNTGGYDSQGRTMSTITFPREGSGSDGDDGGGVRSAQ